MSLFDLIVKAEKNFPIMTFKSTPIFLNKYTGKEQRKKTKLQKQYIDTMWWALMFFSFFFHSYFLSLSVGVGGNLVAIQASRISTYLHFWSIPGVLPYKMRQHWPNPCITFFSAGNTTAIRPK